MDEHPCSLDTEGPGGEALHARVARASVGGIAAIVLVAAPAEAIAGPVGEAMATLALGIVALAVALAALAFAQVKLGLRPLALLSRQLVEIGEGRRDRLPGDQPREISRLVDATNQLLDRNAANLEKARRHVANLAHGLKTPLATLRLGIERPDGPDTSELQLLLGEIETRVRHHLARARAGALAGPERTRTRLAPRLTDIGNALRHIHAERHLTLVLECPEDLVLACEANDVDEMFGNLLDNAFKYARHWVACTARLEHGQAFVEIGDDGGGLTDAEIATVLQPGRRLDEQQPGFGFGLTIARELVELYGGDLTLVADPGGLLVHVQLPAVRA